MEGRSECWIRLTHFLELTIWLTFEWVVQEVVLHVKGSREGVTTETRWRQRTVADRGQLNLIRHATHGRGPWTVAGTGSGTRPWNSHPGCKRIPCRSFLFR